MNNNEQLTKSYMDMIDDTIQSYIITSGDPYDIAKEAMIYSLTSGGKRVRSILLLEFCRLNGGDINKALPIAAAIEMVHAYSLIHDDLPCMDDDDMRRGKPSCHAKFGEATALLAGDALLTMAFEIISTASTIDMLSADSCLRAIRVLASCAGIEGMVGGQVIDLLNEGKDIDEQTLNVTHLKKTGALIKAACKLGVIAANGSADAMKKAEEFAQSFGLAFQIVDDILDVVGDEKTLGKPNGSDADNRKTTYVTLYGLESAKSIATETTARSLAILKECGNSEYLQSVISRMLNRSNKTH